MESVQSQRLEGFLIAATGRGCGTFLALRMDKLRRDNKVLRRMNKDLSHQVKKQGDELKKLKTSIQRTKLSHQASTHHYTQIPPYRSHLLFGEIGTGAVASVHWPADDLGIPSGAKARIASQITRAGGINKHRKTNNEVQSTGRVEKQRGITTPSSSTG